MPIDLCSFPHWSTLAAVDILIVVSFFFFLSLARWVSAAVIQAGIIGQIAVGIIYGVPLANILKHYWQETFVTLGYVGLILIIFEGKWKFSFCLLDCLASWLLGHWCHSF
jgi:hypothetical protein